MRLGRPEDPGPTATIVPIRKWHELETGLGVPSPLLLTQPSLGLPLAEPSQSQLAESLGNILLGLSVHPPKYMAEPRQVGIRTENKQATTNALIALVLSDYCNKNTTEGMLYTHIFNSHSAAGWEV